MSAWWSWGLTVLSLTVAWLAGSRRRVAWLVGLFAQLMWLTYAITTRQWGFIVSVIVFVIIYWRNWQRWAPQAHEGGCNVDDSAAG